MGLHCHGSVVTAVLYQICEQKVPPRCQAEWPGLWLLRAVETPAWASRSSGANPWVPVSTHGRPGLGRYFSKLWEG